MAKIDECLEMRESMLVLLLEDQPLIAMDTEATLRRAGFANIVHLVSVDDALAWLSTSRPDLAVMEIRLKGKDARPVAERLAGQKVPILLYTAVHRRLVEAGAYPPAAWLSKPSEIEAFAPILAQLLGGR